MRMTSSITSPPPQPARQFHRFFEGVTPKLGVWSSWNGQRPMRLSGPMRFELDSVVPAQVLDLHLALDALQLLVGNAGHVTASEAKNASFPGEKPSKSFLIFSDVGLL